MVRAAALAFLAFATGALAQNDSPWLDWVVAHAPNGFDITPDGTIWINLTEVGLEDDYAIRARDYQSAVENRNQQPSFWIRGYHRRNPDVSYRESKTYFTVDCQRNTITRLQASYFAPDGTQIYRVGREHLGYIVPGTYAAEYHRLLCLTG